ncbi:MAG TPA: deoxyguanosinetriphosphate triphosphohydrolase [candidate division Zixibacteria bacterium]|nr:deoxyguanosinetriphosphate triphosphohydrolase [candidate division Zixibacteria bacterium]
MNNSIRTRQEFEKTEAQFLAPYAAKSAQSRGRVYPQEEHPLRTAFQRDRDRTIHSAAFRRMEYKTQVFIPHESDHFRTRLTHTIEVAQISRTMARSLGLNEDLAEAIALVHDLGHTPFGHAGEDVLNELLKKWGGFNHNRQSLRVVDVLERRYPDHPGLNLTYEVREGIVKHETKVKLEAPGFDSNERPTMEASLVDIADEIAYNAHDIDDGLSSGFISLDNLRSADFAGMIGMDNVSGDDDKTRYAIVRGLIDRLVSDVLNETGKRIKDSKILSLNDVRNSKSKLCGYANEMSTTVKSIKEFLFSRLYRHPEMEKHSKNAALVIEGLFQQLTTHSELLPPNYRERLKSEKLELVAADYIAGMTDRFAEKTFEDFKN